MITDVSCGGAGKSTRPADSSTDSDESEEKGEPSRPPPGQEFRPTRRGNMAGEHIAVTLAPGVSQVRLQVWLNRIQWWRPYQVLAEALVTGKSITYAADGAVLFRWAFGKWKPLQSCGM